MKHIQINPWYGKTVACVFALAAMMLLSMSASCLAADFVGIKMYPEHVGVFTTVGTQQFVAFGIGADGGTTNITSEVSWESSDPAVVSIDEAGLATIVSGTTSGQVKITCAYPKAGKNLSNMTKLLLAGGSAGVRSYTVTANYAGDGEGTVSSLPVGIDYSCPTTTTGSIVQDQGSPVTVVATPTDGGTVSWGTSCTEAGGVVDDVINPPAISCAFVSLDGNKTITATFTAPVL